MDVEVSVCPFAEDVGGSVWTFPVDESTLPPPSPRAGERNGSALFVNLRLNDLVITVISMVSLSDVGHLCLENVLVVFQGSQTG